MKARERECSRGGNLRVLRSDKNCKIPGTIFKKKWDNEFVNYPLFQLTPMKKCIPAFFGYSKSSDGYDVIVMEDLLYGFKSPCFIDIKIGQRRFDLWTSDKHERKRVLQRGSTSESIFVRIIEMQIRKNNELVKEQLREIGYRQSEDEFYECIREFLPGNYITYFKQKVKEIKDSLVKTKTLHPNLRLYGCSILVALDGDAQNIGYNSLRVKLIDLAHSYFDLSKLGIDVSASTYDDHVITGLQNLINI